MNQRVLTVILFISTLGFISCNNKKDVGKTNNLNQDQITETLLVANQAAIDLEIKQIDSLIGRSGWNMLKTATGLRYQIIEEGNGPKAETGKIASFEYETKLLSGEIIYSSKKSGPKEFRIGSGGVESGLEEGILFLHTGDRARFVIPSFLAHGLSGDQDRIPPKATLIITIELIYLK